MRLAKTIRLIKSTAVISVLVLASGCPFVAQSPLDALISAIRNGDEQLAATLIDEVGWRATYVENDGSSCRPIHEAARWGRYNTVSLLLDRGADPNDRDSYGKTPLMRACGHSDCGRILERLIAAGADVNATLDGTDQTCLHLSWGDAQATEILLKAGADPNAKDKWGNTPLHALAHGVRGDSRHKGSEAGIPNLLAAGADTTARNNEGFTPLDIAVKFKRYEVRDMLARVKTVKPK